MTLKDIQKNKSMKKTTKKAAKKLPSWLTKKGKK